jgi:hypothetical protein
MARLSDDESRLFFPNFDIDRFARDDPTDEDFFAAPGLRSGIAAHDLTDERTTETKSGYLRAYLHALTSACERTGSPLSVRRTISSALVAANVRIQSRDEAKKK